MSLYYRFLYRARILDKLDKTHENIKTFLAEVDRVSDFSNVSNKFNLGPFWQEYK